MCCFWPFANTTKKGLGFWPLAQNLRPLFVCVMHNAQNILRPPKSRANHRPTMHPPPDSERPHTAITLFPYTLARTRTKQGHKLISLLFFTIVVCVRLRLPCFFSRDPVRTSFHSGPAFLFAHPPMPARLFACSSVACSSFACPLRLPKPNPYFAPSSKGGITKGDLSFFPHGTERRAHAYAAPLLNVCVPLSLFLCSNECARAL